MCKVKESTRFLTEIKVGLRTIPFAPLCKSLGSPLIFQENEIFEWPR
jgi:hypothetical protein